MNEESLRMPFASRLVDLVEVAEFFGVSKRTVHRWVGDDVMAFPQPVPGIGRVVRFKGWEVQAWVDRQGAKAEGMVSR